MTGRERLMTAMECGKPDRLPCQVHNWMDRYLRVYMNGISPLGAYRFFDMDPVFYTGPGLVYSESDQAKWEERWIDLGMNSDGVQEWRIEITTPEGMLVKKLARNDYTQWQSEHLIKSQADFELFEKYQPVPVAADLTPMSRARDLVGDQGIVRIAAPGYGQGSPWQDLCELMGMEELIMAAMDEPEWVHHALKVILDHRVRIAGLLKGSAADVVETGGGRHRAR